MLEELKLRINNGKLSNMQNFDHSDMQILAALQSNARQTNRAIAEEVGLAPSTTLERIRSLEG